MRVVQLISHMGAGGAQVLVGELAKKDKKKDEHFFLSLCKMEKTKGVSGRFIEPQKKSKFSIQPFFLLKKVVEDKNIQIVHCHLIKAQLFALILKIFSRRDIKLIFHEHGKIFLKKNFFYKLFLKFAQKNVDVFIAVSNETKRGLVEIAKIDENKIKVLYNFVDLELPSENATVREKERLGIKKEDFVIGFVGRLDPVKNLDFLLRAFKKITAKNSQAKLLIVGSGSEEESLKKLSVELGVEDKVLFLGYKVNNELYFSMFDVFVIPSESEACPMVIFEAMVAKVPVLGSKIPQLEEFILTGKKKRGLMFELRNEDDLNEKMAEIMKGDELRKQIASNGFQFAKEHVIRKYPEKLEKVYRSVIEMK